MPLAIPFGEFPAFMLVLTRVAAIIGTMPLLGDASVPRQVKIAIALLLAAMLYPSVNGYFIGGLPDNLLAWLPAIFMEVVFGGIIGYTVRLIAVAFEFAGEIMGYMLGLTLAQAVDPQTQTPVPLIGQFLTVLNFLILLALDAHHTILQALVTSFSVLPPMAIHLSASFADLMITLVFGLFTTGLKIAAPVVAAILLANVGMGVISRAVPQMHVMMVAMPMTVALGFLALGVSLPYVVALMSDAYIGLEPTLANLIVSMQ